MPAIIKSFTKGYKYEIRPTQSQKDYLAKAFGHNRFVWNQCLNTLKVQYDTYMSSGTTAANRNKDLRPQYDISSLSSMLSLLKAQYPWLYEVSAVSLQQTTRHLSMAYTAFFKGLKRTNKAGLPRFKNRYTRQAISLVGTGFSLDNEDLYIAKTSEPLKVLWSRVLPSEPSSITISKESNGRYYVSFVCQYTSTPTSGTNTIGLDLGIKSLYVDSNGHQEQSLVKLLIPIETYIKRLQRKLSKKTKGTIAYSKLCRRLASWHLKLRNVRNDLLHKLSRRLIDKSHVIVLEDLAVANMVKNHNLARSISMSSWSKFVQYLSYKAKESQHSILLIANRYFPSSKTCNACGVINTTLRLQDRKWTCASCHTHHDRDENAASNLHSLFLKWSNREDIRLSDYAGCIVLDTI